MKRRFTSRIVLSTVAIAAMVGLGTLVFMTGSVKAQKKTTKATTVQKTRLTGTYRLNPSLGDNVQALAERATQNLPESQRQTAFDNVLNTLAAADMIAIERRGTTITLMSSHAPRVSILANGVTRTETTTDGSSARVRAVLNGDQLVISSSGAGGNDFTVWFDLIDAAGRLSVTRRVYNNQLNQPIIAQSLYERTSDLARWDIYNAPATVATPTTTTGQVATSGTFVVPNGTSLVGELNNQLSTKSSKNGDRFTLTVTEPSQYAGAIIDGYVNNVKRSGKLTGRSEMTFNFDTIRLKNGRTYKFAGIVENLRTPNNETVKVDNEGAVREAETRTSTTGKRTAVGTAVGAIIGAIAGGGKGAAIGAIIGAGAGAGSVYIQGRDDLELTKGTEVTLRASAPQQ
ncbi:MAG TPA: YMGG-like glycine zipper-containing protein [Pyrinomonadaceae bacterium]|nr:YMGG-like glycine zipper-containing protein [Pyrinomonadaceae bacterium]